MIRPRIKKKYTLIVSSVIIFIICVLTCVVHVNLFREKIKAQMMESLQIQAGLSSQVISQRFDSYRTMAVRGADSIMELPILSSDAVTGVLRQNEFNQFDMISFIDRNGKMYLSGGLADLTLNAEQMKILSNLYYYEDAAVVENFVGNTEKNNGVMVVSPVRRTYGDVGYFVGFQHAQKDFSSISFEYYDINPACYVVKEDGDVILQNGKLEANDSIGGIVNILDSLKTIGNGTSGNEKRIADMENAIINEEKGVSRVDSLKESFYAVYTPITGMDQWEFVCIIPEKVIREEINPMILSEVYVCALIIIIVFGMVAFIFITENKAGKTIEELAYNDELTCAKSMAYFRKRASELIQMEHEYPYIIEHFDIMNFRLINESFGHERGDEILKMTAQFASEVIGTKEVFARATADHFVVLAADLNDLAVRRENLSDRINAYARSIDVNYPITLRMGYYKVQPEDININEMIDKANVARKTIGREDKNLIVSYSDDMNKSIRKREEIESAMENALLGGEFKVFLQAKYDLENKQISGAEALVRWIRSDGTLVYPDEFIPLFEQNGFVEKLDFYMLESICRRLRELIDAGHKVYPISVNQSRILLMNNDYVKKVKRILKKYNIPKNIIELELTETIFFDEREKMISIINELHENEVVLSIDDFGSGYSSLNLLKDVPFDILKIDRAFFSQSSNSESSKWILKKIVELAEGLGVKCICEGVETLEQEKLLREIGCTLAQGFLYSRPIPMEDFIERYVYA